MALSLGDVALAFAGGAADEFNKQHAEKRQQARDLEKMRKAQKLRLAETMYLERYKENKKARDDIAKIESMGGAEHPAAIVNHLMTTFGYDMNTAVKVAKSGQFKGIPMPTIQDNPYGNLENIEEILNSPKTDAVTRSHKRIAGKMVNLGEVPPSITAPSSSPISTMSDEEKMSFYDLLESKGASKIHNVKTDDRGQTIVTYQTSEGEIKREFYGTPEGFKGKETAPKVSTNFSTVVSAEGGEDIIATPYTTSEQGGSPVVVLGEPRVVGKKARSESDKEKRKVKALEQFREDTAIVSEVINAGEQLSKYRTAEQTGVPGAAAEAIAFFDRQIEAFTGAPVSDKGLQLTTIADKMIEDFNPEDKRVARTFLESRMALGKAELYETILLYKAAKMLKPEGKLNVDDIERMENIVRRQEGSGFQAGVINDLIKEARVQGISKSRAYAKEMGHRNAKNFMFINNPEKGIRGWAYEYTDDEGNRRPVLIQ